MTYLGPATHYPASERCPELRQPEVQRKPEAQPMPDDHGFLWTVLKRAEAPEKHLTETPIQYLKRIDKWSCKLMADVRTGLRAKGDPSAMRRRWDGFALVLEAGVRPLNRGKVEVERVEVVRG